MINNEDQLTAACFQWAWNEYPITRNMLFHVPNEGKDKRSIAIKVKLQAMGVLYGIMDFVWLIGEGTGIELKMPGNCLSKNQEKVHKAWNAAGKPTWVVYDLESFQKVVLLYLSEPIFNLPAQTYMMINGQSSLYQFKY